MNSTDSSREIEAIKQRLAAVKTRVVVDSNNVASTKAMATKMIESAQSMSDAANKELEEAKAKAKRMMDELDNTKSMTQSNIDIMQSQLETSQMEVQEVEKLLAKAEERAKQEVEGSNKRRKISPQTVSSGVTVKTEDENDYDKETDNEEDQDNNNITVIVKKEEDDDHAYDDETDKEDEDDDETTNQANNTVGINTTANTRHTANTKAAARQSTTSNVNQIFLEGCGTSTYTKVVGQIYNGVPVYSNGDYVIYRDPTSLGPDNWFISVWHGDVNTIGKNNNDLRYGSPNNADSMTPPTNGWVQLNDWDGPAPSLLKKCGKCGKPKKRHSYRAAEWDKRNDDQRMCQVCIKTKAASLAHRCFREELKEAGEYAKKVSPTPLLDEVDQVLVEGCGNVEINGIYIRSAHNGTAPTYTKRGVWKDKSVTFEIFWDKVNTWYIGLEYRRTESRPGWEREILFKHQVMIMGTEKTILPKMAGKQLRGFIRLRNVGL